MWQIEKQKNGNYKCTPANGDEERVFFLDGHTLEPVTYWFCSYPELLEIVQQIQQILINFS